MRDSAGQVPSAQEQPSASQQPLRKFLRCSCGSDNTSPVHAAIIMHVFEALQDILCNGSNQVFFHAIWEPASRTLDHQELCDCDCSLTAVLLLSEHNMNKASLESSLDLVLTSLLQSL